MKLMERRAKRRFPMRREMRYKVLEGNTIIASGSGETVDMSSAGVAFATEQEVNGGAFIELSISWPVLLDSGCPMRLVVFGRVVRTADQIAVCSVDKYEFRTQSRTVQVAASRNDGMLQRWADGFKKETVRTRVAAM